MVTNKLSKSLFELYPEAEDYWDYDKNTEDPSHLSVKSQNLCFGGVKKVIHGNREYVNLQVVKDVLIALLKRSYLDITIFCQKIPCL